MVEMKMGQEQVTDLCRHHTCLHHLGRRAGTTVEEHVPAGDRNEKRRSPAHRGRRGGADPESANLHSPTEPREHPSALDGPDSVCTAIVREYPTIWTELSQTFLRGQMRDCRWPLTRDLLPSGPSRRSPAKLSRLGHLQEHQGCPGETYRPHRYRCRGKRHCCDSRGHQWSPG